MVVGVLTLVELDVDTLLDTLVLTDVDTLVETDVLDILDELEMLSRKENIMFNTHEKISLKKANNFNDFWRCLVIHLLM